MIPGPSELVGPGTAGPDPFRDEAVLRYALCGVAALWAAAALRARSGVVLLAGVAFSVTAAGFWVLALGRPYGLLVESAATRRAAELAVLAEAGGADSFVPGEPAASWGWDRARRMGLPLEAVVQIPTWLPALVPPLLAIAIHVLWAGTERLLGACLWLAFSSGDLDALRGLAFVPGLWTHPGAGLALLALVPLLLALGRTRVSDRTITVLGGSAMLAWWLLSRSGPGLGWAGAVAALTFDQGLWLPLALAGLWRGAESVARLLVGAGAALIVASAVLGQDAWGAHALFRMGLILAASEPIARLLDRAGAAAARTRFGARRRFPRERLGLALLLVALVPGTFLAWWDPVRTDPVAGASLEPVSPALRAPMEWIRRNTPPRAVFVAGDEYATMLAVSTGRRVLRAPDVLPVGDEDRRRRAERLVLSGRESAALRQRYALTHVFYAPGEFAEHGIRMAEDLEARTGLRPVYRNADGFRIYVLPER